MKISENLENLEILNISENVQIFSIFGVFRVCKDMDQWFKLFDNGLKAKYLPDHMINRMTKYSKKPAKLTKTESKKRGSKGGSPTSTIALGGLLDRVQQHQSKSNGKSKGKTKGKMSMKRHSDPPIDTLKTKQNSNSSRAGRVRFAHSFDETEEEMSTSKTRSILTLDDAAIDSAISPELKEHNLSPGTPNSPSDSRHSFSPSSKEDVVAVIGPQDGDSTYEFAYGFLRDIVYGQMLFNQRKQVKA